MSVNKLLDVEEHVWSPMYGLKGNVDATVQVVMKDGENERTLTVPFEIKTGKNNSNPSHKAQTALYTLLLSDRYGILNAILGIASANEQQILKLPMAFCTTWRRQRSLVYQPFDMSYDT